MIQTTYSALSLSHVISLVCPLSSAIFLLPPKRFQSLAVQFLHSLSLLLPSFVLTELKLSSEIQSPLPQSPSLPAVCRSTFHNPADSEPCRIAPWPAGKNRQPSWHGRRRSAPAGQSDRPACTRPGKDETCWTWRRGTPLALDCAERQS